MVAPGLAAFDTIMRLHSAPLIGHPNATWGVTEGNPIHDAIRRIAAQTGVDFSVDVTINRDRQITSAFAGGAVRRARGRVPGGWPLRDASGARAVRRGRHDQQRLSAGPEPVPVGQGDVCGGEDP